MFAGPCLPCLLQMDAVNDMRLKDAQARHDKLLEELKQVNLKHRAEYDELVRARKVRG